MRNEHSLPLLLTVLRDERFTRLHNRVISALVCFLYDDIGLTVLINEGLIPLLTSHLIRVVSEIQNVCDGDGCVVSSIFCDQDFRGVEKNMWETCNETHVTEDPEARDNKHVTGDPEARDNTRITDDLKTHVKSTTTDFQVMVEPLSPKLLDSPHSNSKYYVQDSCDVLFSVLVCY